MIYSAQPLINELPRPGIVFKGSAWYRTKGASAHIELSPESLNPHKERRGLLGVLKQEMDLDAEHVDLEW
jgi:hypothetical protein